MIPALPLKDMTLKDKLSTMEVLWDDICRQPQAYPSPDWHGDILNQREAAVQEGKDRFENWEDVKREIWDSVK